MSSIQETFNNYNNDRYTTIEDLEQALTDVYNKIVFDNENIDDITTYTSMKEKLDRMKRRRFCNYCEVFYSIDEALPHENTNEHRSNATIQLGKGFNEIESAIGSR